MSSGGKKTGPLLKSLLLGMLALCLLPTLSLAYYNIAMFWQVIGPTKFIFTTSPQTLNANTCSSIVTVQGVNGGGSSTNAPIGHNLSLYLFGNSATFYSDVGCTNPITSVTMAGGTNTTSFYFEAQATNPIEASTLPLNVTPAVQTETINSGSAISGFAYTNPSTSYGNGGQYWGCCGQAVSYAVNNGKLYLGYATQWSTNAMYVSVYNGNDSAPNWADANGGNSITYANTGNPYVSPQLISFNGSLFATWQEKNVAGFWQIRVRSYNGTAWSSTSTPIDGGGLNISTSENAENPVLGIYNGKLYIAWDENNLVHVARWGGSTSWTRIDDNGAGGTTGTSMNYASDTGAAQPALYGTTSGLFAAWGNNSNQLRVKLFNGSSWSAADGGTGIQISYAGASTFAEFNGETYIGWEDGNDWPGAVHIKVYQGGTTWALVDGGATQGLNFQSGVGATIPELVAFQGRLYAIWNENNSMSGTSYSSSQTRVSVYNGNDSSPSWTPVVGKSTDGMGYIPWVNNSDFNPSVAILSNKLYTGFADSESTDTAVFEQATTPSQLWFPNVTQNGTDGGIYETSGCVPNEVRAVDASGHPSFVTTSTTVTLSATGVNFFSDSYCSQALPSNQVTIPVGDSGAHFFFMVATGGDSFTITGSASGLSGNQSLGNPGDDVWIGGASCDGNWTTSACWSQSAVPGQYETAVFSGSRCSTNCSATINTGNLQNMNNILLEADYTGTVTQGSGFSPTINGVIEVEGGTFATSASSANTFTAGTVFVAGSGTFNAGPATLNLQNGYTQTGGTFNGGNSVLIIGGNYTLMGGSFTAPSSSGSFIFNQGNMNVSGSPTFNANGGTVTFAQSGTTWTINPGAGIINFNNVLFQTTTSGGVFSMQGTMNVLGNLTINNLGGGLFTSGQSPSAIIAVSGNVTVTAGGQDSYGNSPFTLNSTLEFVGSGTQTLTSSSDGLPGNIVINSTGTVNLVGTIYAETWTYLQGTVNAGTSTVNFYDQGITGTLNSGTMHFNNVNLGNGGIYSLTPTLPGNTYIDGNLSVNIPVGQLTGGTIILGGNLTMTNNGAGGTTALTFTGGNTQTFSSTGGSMPSGTFTVNKTPGTTLTLNSTLTLPTAAAVNITSGILNIKGNALTCGNITIGDTLTATTASITPKGNWTNNGTFNAGTSTVNFNRTGSFTLGGTNSTTFNNVTFNRAGATWTLADPITVNATLTLTAGTLAAAGYAITLGGVWQCLGTFSAGSDTVTLASGSNHTISGSTTFYNLTMDDSGNSANDTLTFASAATQTVTGTLLLKGNATNDLILQSSSPNSQWKINPTTATVSNVNVQDSDNTNAITIAAGAGSTDSGNNTNWSFGADDVWIGGASCDGNWTTAACWSNGVPISTSVVAFNNSCSTHCSPSINTTVTIQDLYVESNYPGTITQASGNSITVSGELELSAGTLVASSSASDAITIGTSFLIDGGTFTGGPGALVMNGISNFTISSGTYTAGTGALTFTGGSWQTFDQTGGTFSNVNLVINKSAQPLNLQTAASFQSVTVTAATFNLNTFNLTVSGSITNSGTLTSTSGTISLGGNWTNSGTFTPGTSTVSLNNASHTISGTTSFYNLSMTMTSAQTLTFQHGTTQTITNALTLGSGVGKVLTLKSDSSGNAWNLSPPAASYDYLSLQDSDNTSGNTLHAGIHGTNVSGNSGWTFP
jgi:hypothetical protein